MASGQGCIQVLQPIIWKKKKMATNELEGALKNTSKSIHKKSHWRKKGGKYYFEVYIYLFISVYLQ